MWRVVTLWVASLLIVACAPRENPSSVLASTGTPPPSRTVAATLPAITPAPTVQIPFQVTRPSPPSQSEASALPDPGYTLIEFPLARGTTWVYSYTEYEATTTNPTQITTATYLFTETVVDTHSIPPFFVAHVQHEERLVKADPDWAEPEPRRTNELWYVVKGQQVYISHQPLVSANIQTDSSLLAYDFPFVIGKSWCPITYVKGEKIQDCTASGKRLVVSQESYLTAAGSLNGFVMA